MKVNSHTQGRVLGGNRIDMLLDTGAFKVLHVKGLLHEESYPALLT